MTFLNAVQLFFLGVLTLVMGVPAILLALLLPGKARKGNLFLLVSKTYARIALWFFRVKVEGRGRENVDAGKAYVFMSNHISHADSPALALVISHPLHWVFKKELAKIPVFGWVLLACGQVMVDRLSPERSKASLEEAISGLSG
ncbi:MAG: lysophospholipid acyltransferase family protein, partial [Thermodesulfobacteriota bacterium]|nr:lysophospholipid acyltransferase family protein [Thermodesulfobacteriota bacterium]